jgi:hypothetical protein
MRARPSFLWVVGIADAQKDDLRFDLSVQAAPLEPSLPVFLLLACRSASPKAPAPLHPFVKGRSFCLKRGAGAIKLLRLQTLSQDSPFSNQCLTEF